MTTTTDDRARLVARESPLGFILYAKPHYSWAQHLALANERIVRAIFTPGAKRRLAILMPPRHSKTTLASIATPAWYLGLCPDRRVICASAAGSLASRIGRTVRGLVEEHGRATHGIEVSEASSAAHEWTIAGREGGMISVGVGGMVTGTGANVFLIDDPIKDAAQAFSLVWRDRTWEWVQGVMETRLEPDAAVILCITRWHEDDIAGRFLRDFPEEWDVLRLPALAEDGDDPLGREEGEALWPMRYDATALRAIERRVGSYFWAAEYQQRPAPEEGAAIKREWLTRRWKVLPPRFDAVIDSWDMTFKETTTGSFVVGQKWGRVGAECYLLDQVRGRWDFPETREQFRAFSARAPRSIGKLVEEKANGAAIISELRKEIGGIIAVQVDGKHGSKAARLAAVSPYIEARNVILPSAPWVEGYVDELCGFPNAAHDDQVDATSQALAYLTSPTETSVSTSAGKNASPTQRRDAVRSPALADRPSVPITRVPLWGD